MNSADIFIVGGGSSLRTFDWARLNNRRVIAVNRAYETVPNAEVVYFNDLKFWTWHGKKLARHPGRIVTGCPDVSHPRVEHVKLAQVKGLSLVPGSLAHGNNSGYSAINLAVQLGASRIYLLGFDMKGDAQGRVHWHNGYPTPSPAHVYRENMMSYFPGLAQALTAAHVKTFVIGESELTCFDKINFEDVEIACAA